MRVEASPRHCKFMGLVTLHFTFDVIAVKNVHFTFIESIIYPAIRKTPSKIRVAKSRVATFHSSPGATGELPRSRVKSRSAKANAGDTLNHKTTRTSSTKQRNKIKATRKGPNLRPIPSIQTTKNNPQKCPPLPPTAPPPPPLRQQTMPATRLVSSARSSARQ
jgi:hypothetical protein